MAEEKQEKSVSNITALPQNWQTMEPSKIVDVLLEFYQGNTVDALALLKQESNKVGRLIKSGRTHNIKLAKRKHNRLERAKGTLLGRG